MDGDFSRAADRPDVRDSAPHYDVWFSENLKTVKAHRDLSYDDIGRPIGMEGSTVHRVVSRIHCPNIRTATAIASSLGLELAELLLTPPAIFRRRFTGL